MMKAAILSGHGSEEQLKYVKNRPKPECTKHEVRIKVKACALDQLDIQVRRGDFQQLIDIFPPSLDDEDDMQHYSRRDQRQRRINKYRTAELSKPVGGYQVSGIVDDIGSEVGDMKVGDEVVCICALDSFHGGAAEYTLQPSWHVAPKPELISHEETAAALLPGLRAYSALHYSLNIKAGDFLLFCAPPTCADTVAVQIAGTIGAKVIVSAATTEAMNLYGDCGNHVVRVIDATNEEVTEAVLEETGGLGVQCILDYQHLGRARIGLSKRPSSRPAPQKTQNNNNNNHNNNNRNNYSHKNKSLEQQRRGDTKQDHSNNDNNEGNADERAGGKNNHTTDTNISDNRNNNNNNNDDDNTHNSNNDQDYDNSRRENYEEYNDDDDDGDDDDDDYGLGGGLYDSVGDQKSSSSSSSSSRRRKQPHLSNADLIKCLAMHGRWTTSDPNLQLDPPLSVQLYLRGASLSYLFAPNWLLAPTKQGKFIHILRDLMDKLSKGQVHCPVAKCYPLDKIRQAHRELKFAEVGKVVIRF